MQGYWPESHCQRGKSKSSPLTRAAIPPFRVAPTELRVEREVQNQTLNL